MIRFTCGLALLLSASPLRPVSAQGPGDTLRLVLAEARTRAFRANPDLAAAFVDTAVARGQLRQAGLLAFNPIVDVLGRPSGDQLEAGVSQEIEIFGQRARRRAAARAGLDRSRASAQNAFRLIVADVDRAFFALAAAEQRTLLSRDVLEINTRLADVSARQLKEGEISRIDYNLAVVELGRARARAAVAAREETAAAIELGRLTGIPLGTPIAAIADTAAIGALVVDVDSVVRRAVERRPDLLERSAAAVQASAELSATTRQALPNPVLRAVVEQPTKGGPSTLRPGIGFTLPFLNRRQGDREALRAAVRRADLERAATSATIRAEVAKAVAAYRSASTELAALEAAVLIPARQNRQLAEVAHREGKIGVPVLLIVQNQAIDAELEYWNAWLALRFALTDLAAVTADNTQMALDARGTTK